GHEHNEFLRSGLLDFLDALANGVGRANQRLLANASRWNIALEWGAFGPGFLVGFGDGAIEEDGATDGVVIAPHRLAVLLDDGEFALQAFGIEVADIAGIRVLRDHFERYFFAAAADQQGDMRLLHPFGLVDRAMHRAILPLVFGVFIAPHLQDDLYRVAQLFQARRAIGIVVAISPKFLFVPARADAEIQATMTQYINRACHLCQQRRVAIAVACDHLPDTYPFGVSRKRGGAWPRLESYFLGGRRHGVKVVKQPD